MQIATQINVRDLEIGDMVDLENDKYVDPDDTIHEYVYAEVLDKGDLEGGLIVEFSTCVIKFPYNHLVYRIDGA